MTESKNKLSSGIFKLNQTHKRNRGTISMQNTKTMAFTSEEPVRIKVIIKDNERKYINSTSIAELEIKF